MIELRETNEMISGLWQLPEGWEWTYLGDAFSLRSGTLDPSRTPNEIFSLYSMPSYETLLANDTKTASDQHASWRGGGDRCSSG